VIDSGCSRHMTGNISYLSYFKELNEGYVAFGGNPKGGKITSKGKIKKVLPQSNSVLNTVSRPISAALPHLLMTWPKHAYHVVTKSHSPIRRHLPLSPSSKNSTSPPRVTAAKSLVVSAAQ
nr:putative ribonuclease H-like domain-containing protein [Tanacetum cinerariifolium]